MNKIITTSVLDPSTQQPFTARSLDFLQDATKETVAGLVNAMIGDTLFANTNTIPVVLAGLTESAPDYTGGYIFYQGEVFLCDGWTGAVSDTLICNIVVTNGTPDPVLFTDGVSRNVHNVRKIVITDSTTGSGDFDLLDCIWFRGNREPFTEEVFAGVDQSASFGSSGGPALLTVNSLDMEITTPNDGITRNVLLTFKGEVGMAYVSGASPASSLYVDLYLPTGGTVIDKTVNYIASSSDAGNATRVVYLNRLVSLQPNTTVQVRISQSMALSCTIANCIFTAMEIK